MKPRKYIETFYQWTSFKERVQPYLTDKKHTKKLEGYVLPRNMNDTEIKSETNSQPIDVEVLADCIQKQCTDKNKWYIFHVKTPKEIVAVLVNWNGDRWDVRADDWGYVGPWFEGRVFVFSATAGAKTLKSDSLTLSNLDARNKVLEKKLVKINKLVENIEKIISED